MRNANVSVIGLVCVASDADADMYPLNTPVLLTGITQDNLDKAGEDGTLETGSLNIQSAALPDTGEASPEGHVIVVRTTSGVLTHADMYPLSN